MPCILFPNKGAGIFYAKLRMLQKLHNTLSFNKMNLKAKLKITVWFSVCCRWQKLGLI